MSFSPSAEVALDELVDLSDFNDYRLGYGTVTIVNDVLVIAFESTEDEGESEDQWESFDYRFKLVPLEN